MTDCERTSRDSASISEDRIARLREIFPEAIVEGKVNIEQLRTVLGDEVDTRSERYSFTWAGKRDAIRLLQVPSRATLVPCPEESVNFDTTSHAFIEGENLEVLKLLYKSYFGRVKMIYIDPPYNTGGDFVYPDDFADPLDRYLELTGQKNGNGDILTTNPETSGRYHSAWLSMMYPRIFVARQLLAEDGVIFVSIDDHEVHNLRLIMNEIFGEENRIECFVWKKSYGGGAKEKYAVTQHEYILLYAKNLGQVQDLWLPADDTAVERYYKGKDEKFPARGPYRLKPLEATKSMDRRDNLVYSIPGPKGCEIWPKRQWWWGRERALKALAAGELVFIPDGDSFSVSYKQYLKDSEGNVRGMKPFSVIDGIYTQHGTADLTEQFDGKLVMQFPKPVALIEKIMEMVPNGEGQVLILDFFAGSCTTAHAVYRQNRKNSISRQYVMVQLPEPIDPETEVGKTARSLGLNNVADIGKDRIRRVISKMKTTDDMLSLAAREKDEDLGFKVFKLVASNYRPWAGVDAKDPEAYAQQLALYADPLVDGWKVDEVIWEVAIKEGYSLTLKIEKVTGLEHNKVHLVTDPDKGQSFRVCLDETLHADDVKKLALAKDDLFICRDKALDDEKAANLALQCRLKTI